MDNEQDRWRDIDFLIGLNDELFYAAETELTRRRLADAYTVQDPQKCGNLE
jgi:hypothetical protein